MSPVLNITNISSIITPYLTTSVSSGKVGYNIGVCNRMILGGIIHLVRGLLGLLGIRVEVIININNRNIRL